MMPAALSSLGLLPVRSTVGIYAGAPLFAFWFLVMSAIWLFLLGIARIFTGTFTPAEVTLTIVIGVGSLFGLRAAYRPRATDRFLSHAAAIATFAILQFAAMWLSVQPFIATR